MPNSTGWQQQLVHDFADALTPAGAGATLADARGVLTRQGWNSLCLSADEGGLGLTWYETAMLAEQLGRVFAPGDVIAPVIALPAMSALAPRRAASVLDGRATVGLVAPAQVQTLSTPRGEGLSYRFTESLPGFVLLPAVGSPGEVSGVEVDAGSGVCRPTPGGDLWELHGDTADLWATEVFRAPSASLWAATTLLSNAHLVGMALAAVGAAIDRARTRRQFGRPVGAQQAIAFPLAAQRTRLEALRLENNAQLLRLDEYVGQQQQAGAHGAEFAGFEADATAVTEALWPLLRECVHHAVHVHGASGLQDGRPTAAGYRLLLAETARLGLGVRRPARTDGIPAAGGAASLRGIGRRRSAHPRRLAQRREPAAVRDTAVVLPTGSCVHELFEQAATRHPEAVALRTATSEITYRELDTGADRFAHFLRESGVGADDVVGLHMDHGTDTVMAILAVLKAGAAYLPLDPGYPPERIAFMVQDSKAAAVVTSQRLSSRLPADIAPILMLEQLQSSPLRRPVDAGAPRVRPDSLAYLIYTSGSTGTPKGVEVEHHSLANRLHWDAATFPLHPGDAVLHHTSLSFDISVWEIFTPLISGATLVVAAPGVSRDPRRLLQDMLRNGVSVLACVPSLLDLLLEEQEPALADVTGLRYVFCGGETLSPELCRRFHALGPPAQLHNFYGPSECTIDVTSWHCRPQDDPSQVPIGRPLANVTVHVLDETGAVVPPGYPGELYVGGAGVARGYRGRPELTAERFVPDPFTDRPEGRLYRTGDLVRMSRDGVLHFIGRSDGQVKVRGHRIELDEIRCTLERHPGVRTAVVRVTDGRIEAHVVPTASTDPVPGADELVDHVRRSLPEYMVPSALATVASIPVTRNGKVDHAALPPARGLRGAPGEEDRTVLGTDSDECVLTALAARVLGVESLSPTEDFFAAGGSSLHAARFVSRVRAECGLDIRLEQFLAAPTIRDLAKAAHSHSDHQEGGGDD